ncbi:MAG: hypothetical protein U0892_14910 [Pirellulales bacterium]
MEKIDPILAGSKLTHKVSRESETSLISTSGMEVAYYYRIEI